MLCVFFAVIKSDIGKFVHALEPNTDKAPNSHLFRPPCRGVGGCHLTRKNLITKP